MGGRPPPRGLELAHPDSQPPASRPPPRDRAAPASSVPPALPALVRRPGRAPPPDPGNTNRRRLARPRSLSQTSPSSSSSPRLLLSGGGGGGRGSPGDGVGPGAGTRPPWSGRTTGQAAGCRAADAGLGLAGPAVPSTRRAAAAAALPGWPSPC